MVKEIRTPKNLIKQEGKVKIDKVPKNFSKSSQCKDKKLNVKIDRNDSNYRNYTDFLRSHEKIRQHIEKYTDQLIEVIDNLVSVKNKKYRLKTLILLLLIQLKEKQRTLLLEYYVECQKLFEISFSELVKAVNNSDIQIVTRINNAENKEKTQETKPEIKGNNQTSVGSTSENTNDTEIQDTQNPTKVINETRNNNKKDRKNSVNNENLNNEENNEESNEGNNDENNNNSNNDEENTE